MKTNGNDASFTTVTADGSDGYLGLTKREYFATTINHDPKFVEFDDMDAAADFLGRKIDTDDPNELIKSMLDVESKIRVMRADSLIEALNKE